MSYPSTGGEGWWWPLASPWRATFFMRCLYKQTSIFIAEPTTEKLMFAYTDTSKLNVTPREAGGHRRSGLDLGYLIRKHQFFCKHQFWAQRKKNRGCAMGVGLGTGGLRECKRPFRGAIQNRITWPRRGPPLGSNNLWAKPTRPPYGATALKIAILTFSAFLCAGSMRDRRSSSNCVDW